MGGVLDRGPLGVDLFFAISGFLITSLLLHERDSLGAISLRRFWIRRSLRIFPLYYVVLALFIVHAVWFRARGAVRDDFLLNIPYYATYTSNWFIAGATDHPIVFAFAWSLATEEQFYLVWPLALKASARRSLALVGPTAIMTALIVMDQGAERGWLVGPSFDPLALKMMRSFSTPIGLGALLALADAHPTIHKLFRLTLGQRWSSLVMLACVIHAAVRPWPLLPTHVAMVALVGSVCARSDHLLAPLFDNRVARHIGVVSYGMYLLNVPVVTATRSLLGPNASALLVFVVAAPLTIVVATATYRWIERPWLRLRVRFREEISPTPTSSPDVA